MFYNIRNNARNKRTRPTLLSCQYCIELSLVCSWAGLTELNTTFYICKCMYTRTIYVYVYVCAQRRGCPICIATQCVCKYMRKLMVNIFVFCMYVNIRIGVCVRVCAKKIHPLANRLFKIITVSEHLLRWGAVCGKHHFRPPLQLTQG